MTTGGIGAFVRRGTSPNVAWTAMESTSERTANKARLERHRELAALGAEVAACRRCERLVLWREGAASLPRAHDGPYAAHGLAGFGDFDAHLVVVGLAPAAHGGNRTGRMFTGDRSGDFLFAGLHRAGYASQPVSASLEDGLELRGAYITAAVRCAPPDNKPLPDERDRCAPFLAREFELLTEATVYLALGAIAFDALVRCQTIAARLGAKAKHPRFRHGLELALENQSERSQTIVASYHPSQRNVFTGRLTEAMFDQILKRVGQLSAQ